MRPSKYSINIFYHRYCYNFALFTFLILIYINDKLIQLSVDDELSNSFQHIYYFIIVVK